MDSVARTCSITECNRKHFGKGYCRLHWKRNHKWGDPHVNKNPRENHGGYQTTEYYSWSCMKSRCKYPSFPKYEYYGGRGIKVCRGISSSFVKFLETVGYKPNKSYTIDRIDPNSHYSCGDCTDCDENGYFKNIRWATKSQQGINQKIRSTNTSGYRGVSRRSDGKKWVAQITHNNKAQNLGSYETKEEAARVYNGAAIEHFGPDAILNKL